MPNKRSPHKLQERRDRFARQTDARQRDWLALSAIRKETVAGHMQMKEKEAQLRTVARAQRATAEVQKHETHRLQTWDSNLSQWHEKVKAEAQCDTVMKMKAIGARMCKLSRALTDSFEASLEAINGEDLQRAHQRIERLQQFSEGMYTEAYNMQHDTDLRVLPPASGYQSRAEYAHDVPWGEHRPRTYPSVRVGIGGTYSRMPPRDPDAVPVGVRGGREERIRHELNARNPFLPDDVSHAWTDPRWG